MRSLRNAQIVKVNYLNNIIECYVLRIDYEEVLVMNVNTFEVLGIHRNQII